MSVPIRALLIEDDEDEYVITRELVAQVSKTDDRAIALDWVSTYDEGLSRMFERQCDILLIDYRLGARSGIELLREAHAHGCMVPAILLTGHGSRDIDREAQQAGAASFLPKDGMTAELLGRSIRYAVEQARVTDKARSSAGFSYAILDALSAHIAVVDADGRIVAVNRAWRELARENGLELIDDGVGTDYGLVCPAVAVRDRDGDADAQAVAEGLRAVLQGEISQFHHEYPCRNPDEFRWFLVRITPIQDGQSGRAVISHQNITSRVRAEQDVREAEERFRTLVEQMPAVADISAIDDPSTPSYVSPQIQQLLGYAIDEWLADPNLWLESVHPDDRERVEAEHRRTNETGEPFSLEYRMLAKDGQIVWIRDDAILVRDDNGEPRHWQGLKFDITAQKDIELALRESEERFRSAFDDAALAMAISTLDGHRIRVNQPYCDLFGYTRDEIMHIPMGDLVLPEDIEQARADGEVLLSGRVARVQSERQLRRKDGEVIWGLANLSIMRDATGEPAFLLTQIQDITERRAAEDRLRDVTGTLQAVFDASPLPMLAIDLDGHVVLWNAMAEALFGWSSEEVIGRPAPIIPAERADEARQHRELANAGRVSYGFETVRQCKDGRLIDVSLSSAPIQQDNGQITGSMAVYIDVTDRKRAEATRTRRDRVLGMVSGSGDLSAILRALCEMIEAEIRDSTAAILLLDDDGVRLRHAASTTLPEPYINAIDGVEVGPTVGSCGSAVWRGEPVIVGDIANDPLWVDFRDLALTHDLRACWSTPIFSEDNQHVLGSFAVYSSWVRFPTEVEMESLLGAAHLARVAIGRKRAEDHLRESEERFRGAFEDAATGLAFVTFDGAYLHVNRTLADMLGYSVEELVGRNYRDVTHPEDIEISEATGDEVLNGVSRTVEFEKRYIHRNGHIIWVQMTTSVIRDVQGTPLYHITHVHDVTRRKQAEIALRDAEARYRGLVESSPAATYIEMLDGSGNLFMSPQIETIMGYTIEEWLSSPDFWLTVTHPDDRERVLAEIGRTNATGDPYDVEYRLFRADGRVVWTRNSARLQRDEQGQPLYWQGLIFDITEQKALQEALQHQAFHDALTGLPNRALLLDRVQQSLTQSLRAGDAVAVLFLDLDNFKIVNDSIGHAAGDELLVRAGERLQECVREGDTVARLGGDEFAIMLTNLTDVGGAVDVAGRVIAAFQQPFEIRGRSLSSSTSIGVALARQGESPGDLLRHADIAMYRAKAQGRNRIEVFDAEMHASVLGRLELEHDLRRAIDAQQFVLHFQPKIALTSGETVGMEALVRWNHPKRGMVPPDAFIPLAEETGLIVPIGAWVLREACLRGQEWCEQAPVGTGVPITMSVNLSARQFRQPDLVQHVAGVLDETGLAGEYLALEITETVIMDDATETIDRLHALKALGVQISIDDFGTGYSSLAYLKRFPVDVIKIDRSFVSGLGVSPEDTAIATAIISLAHSLGITVVAEGVETAEQADHLRHLGCDRAQGFYYARPVPADNITLVR